MKKKKEKEKKYVLVNVNSSCHYITEDMTSLFSMVATALVADYQK